MKRKRTCPVRLTYSEASFLLDLIGDQPAAIAGKLRNAMRKIMDNADLDAGLTVAELQKPGDEI